MAEKYYDITDTSYPPIIIALMERLRYYYCQLLYPDETYAVSKRKFIRTDIGSFAVRDNVQVFNLSNARFPFTAWTFGDPEINLDVYNRYADTGKYYEPELLCMVDMKPIRLQIPMVTFYNTGYDWFRGLTLLSELQTSSPVLNVPIEVNNIETTFPVRLQIEDVAKGNYAWEFESQLVTGKIQDITHYTNVFYHDFTVDTQVNPVDNIEVFLAGYSGENRNDNISLDSGTVVTTPAVTTTTPVDDATSIAVDSNITINFNVSMDEDSVISYLDIYPYVWYDYAFNANSDSVILDPIDDLQSGVLYTVTIDGDAVSGDGVNIGDDYDFSFTTEE